MKSTIYIIIFIIKLTAIKIYYNLIFFKSTELSLIIYKTQFTCITLTKSLSSSKSQRPSQGYKILFELDNVAIVLIKNGYEN